MVLHVSTVTMEIILVLCSICNIGRTDLPDACVHTCPQALYTLGLIRI